MNTDIPTTGYYSVIQFCPDHSRLEAANIGVLLFVPSINYLNTKMSSGNDRVKRFFADAAPSTGTLTAMKKMLQTRFQVERSSLKTYGEMQRFLHVFANEIICSPLRPMRVINPDVELAQLFSEIVGGRSKREAPIYSDGLNQVRSRLEMPDLVHLLERDLSVDVPFSGGPLEVDYAFQNGRYNLIDLKEFKQLRKGDLFSEASRIAVNGRWLHGHPDSEKGERQLLIVASLSENNEDHLEDLMELFREQEVTFYTDKDSEPLAQLIINTAHK